MLHQFEQAQDAVTISNGNFFWGLKEEKEEKADTKKKGKGEEAKKAIKEKMKSKKKAPRKQVVDESFAVDTSQLLADSATEDEENKDNTTIENVLALRDINLSIKQGEFVCIIGDVGSGKSSLLNSMIGDLQYLDPAFISDYKDQKISDQDVIE